MRRRVLLKSAEEVFDEIRAFREDYASILPTEACQSINGFLADSEIAQLDFRPSRGQVRGNVQLALTSLAAFRSEFSYLIADTQAIARRIRERAFIHLTRSIMVDDGLRRRWVNAFREQGERACEKLGAVHLLSHGVWAFKVRALGGRTDLVLGEPLPSASEIERAADVLVLTEWKVVREREQLDDKIAEARRQTELYASGVLAGVELGDYRYLVMVTERITDMPEDTTDGMITYRHVNIPVNPSAPSVTARHSS